MIDENQSKEQELINTPVESQVETLRELVSEAEKWSDLLLLYSRSMLLHYVPLTVLIVGVTIAQLFWTTASWSSVSQSMRLVNLLLFLTLAVGSVLAVSKQAEAVIRYGANKGRHKRWKEKFERLRALEKSLEESLLNQRSEQAG